MKFAELYKDNVSAAKRLLKSMWCRSATTDTQKAYVKQIEELIEKELFASEQYMPLVQCMEQYPSLTEDEWVNEPEKIRELWEKNIFPHNFTPYRHQASAWNALRQTNDNGIKQSMVVTTGTGSGKTECFMLPLVNDLTDDDGNAKNIGCVEALFLYPLNALMEDQKERLHKLLVGTGLKFASYNSNLPREEKEIPKDKNQKKTNEQIKIERDKYPGTIVATRKELWDKPANILLANPSMLEYMLLRHEDQHLFENGKLKWIVIDEAHSYSGAGAAELAMLLRRVLQAFGIKDPNSIRFALSSATIGNEGDESKKTAQLIEFVSKLTGVKAENITPISAERKPKLTSTDPNIERCRRKLIENDYVKLDDLFPNGTISERLAQLDAMCSDDGSVDAPLKAKVHFFYRVPNNGLRVCLDDIDSENGTFRVKSLVPKDSKTPALELMRCEKCGEYFAVAEEVPGKANKYRAYAKDAGNMFDVNSPSRNNKLHFAITDKQEAIKRDGNLVYEINGDEFTNVSSRDDNNIIANINNACPHCAADISSKKKKKNEKDNDGEDEGLINEDWRVARTFRISSEFISRTLAPSILPHLHRYSPKDNEDESVVLQKPHYGQQYISFVDSRQAAARSTLKQNLSQESAWIYSRLMNRLSELQSNAPKRNIRLQRELDDAIRYRDEAIADGMQDDVVHYEQKVREIKQKLTEPICLTWMQAFEFLKKKMDEGGKSEADKLCGLFIDKNNDKEYSEDGKIEDVVKDKYVLQAMLANLGRHAKVDAGQETMGLFTSYYPNLVKIEECPDAVIEFNKKYNVNITLEEWQNLIKIFLDYRVRSDESFCFKDTSCPGIDIKELRRFATQKERSRKPVEKPQVNNNNVNTAVITLLATLIDPKSDNPGNIAKTHREYIEKVIDAFWDNILSAGFLEWDSNTDGYYFNITNIAFKLFDKVYMCDVPDQGCRVEKRPVDTLFMGYSPYIIDGKAVKYDGDPKGEIYPIYEYMDGKKEDGSRVTLEDIREWSKENRKVLYENNLWGESGYFTDRLDYIYSYPNIFIQAEHTAQVDRTTSRQNQYDFKKQEINIMACSTTMEMGVDLGNMELVLMQSIPPHPTNYKQRAGRSGRNNDTRSVAITLCDSGATGLRTLQDPLSGLICRPMTVPTVDLTSRKVIRRHINAALLRVFFKEHYVGDEMLHGRVIDFFSKYIFNEEGDGVHRNNFIMRPAENGFDKAFPCHGIGTEEGTLYHTFKNWLLEQKDISFINDLTNDTYYQNGYSRTDCIEDIDRCYSELRRDIEHLKEAYKQEYEKVAKKDPTNVSASTGYVNSGYAGLLVRKYCETLGRKLIPFFATHRMTPNATMPVAVISFNKSPELAWKKRYTLDKPNDPSYTLREALSQYAPGNSVVIENRAIVVAGVDYTGIDLSCDKNRTFPTLYTDGSRTVIDKANEIQERNRVKWPINGKKKLTLVRPVLYNADITETCTRYAENNPFTCISAQLVDADKWQESSNPRRMLDMRSNNDSGNGQILYTSTGFGYGYAICRTCGKIIVESAPGQDGTKNLPKGFCNRSASSHYNIRRLNNQNKPIECKNDRISRNVVIGDVIQTDFCEIMIRKSVNGIWLNGQSEHHNLLTTLGLTICSTFADYIGKDRNDVDFVVMQNGHLCIYDTNPGGSGYSDQLADRTTMHRILDLCRKRLERIKSKDELIDKYSTRYINEIDIEAAKEWVELALSNYDAIPEKILSKYPNAQPAYISSLKKEIENATSATLFVNSNFERWDFENDNISNEWKERIGRPKNNSLIDIVVEKTGWIPRPIFYALTLAKGYCGGKVKKSTVDCTDEIYPLAIVNEHLYLAERKENTAINGFWANSEIFRTKLDVNSIYDAEEIDLLKIPENSIKFTISRDEKKEFETNELADVVISAGGEKMTNLMNEFIKHCKNNKSAKLKITYRDEYVRTPFGMVVVLDFIKSFIDKFERKDFDLELIGEYYKPHGYKGAKYQESVLIGNAFDFSDNRDDVFLEICESWIDKHFKGSDCKAEVVSEWRNTLPHWRDLKFSCAGKELILYPNGGIVNGWEISKDKVNEYLTHSDIPDEIRNNTKFWIVRGKQKSNDEIMYDVELK